MCSENNEQPLREAYCSAANIRSQWLREREAWSFSVYLCKQWRWHKAWWPKFWATHKLVWAPVAYCVLNVCTCMCLFMCMCVFACASDPAIVWKEEQWHSCALSSRWLWKPNPKPSLAGTQSAGNAECCCLPPETWARIELLFQISSEQ